MQPILIYSTIIFSIWKPLLLIIFIKYMPVFRFNSVSIILLNWINPNTIKNKHSEKNTNCFCGNMKSITMKNICLNTITKEDYRANAPHWPYCTFCYEDCRALLLARPYLSNYNSQKLIPKNVGLIYKPIWYNNLHWVIIWTQKSHL